MPLLPSDVSGVLSGHWITLSPGSALLCSLLVHLAPALVTGSLYRPFSLGRLRAFSLSQLCSLSGSASFLISLSPSLASIATRTVPPIRDQEAGWRQGKLINASSSLPALSSSSSSSSICFILSLSLPFFSSMYSPSHHTPPLFIAPFPWAAPSPIISGGSPIQQSSAGLSSTTATIRVPWPLGAASKDDPSQLPLIPGLQLSLGCPQLSRSAIPSLERHGDWACGPADWRFAPISCVLAVAFQPPGCPSRA